MPKAEMLRWAPAFLNCLDGPVEEIMKIRKIQGFYLFSPFERKLGNSLSWMEGKPASVLKIDTEEGVTGYGEAYQAYGAQQKQLFQVMKSLFPCLAGFSFVAWEELREKLRCIMNEVPAGIQHRIESAFNLAFWDIRGKMENQPVCKLFGCRAKQAIPVYGTGLFYRDVPGVKDQLPLLLHEASLFANAGYHGIKMKAGRYPAQQEAWLIEQVRRELPEKINLMVDANCGMKSMKETVELMKRLEAIGIKWLEEPFSPEAYSQYAEACLQSNGLPIAAGEHEVEMEGFRKLSNAGVAILQPELSLCGGLSQALDLIKLARECQLQLTPHVWGSGVLYSATLNFYSMLGLEHNTLYECPFFTDPLRDHCFNHLFIKQGSINVPVAPGWGIELDEAQFMAHVVESV